MQVGEFTAIRDLYDAASLCRVNLTKVTNIAVFDVTVFVSSNSSNRSSNCSTGSNNSRSGGNNRTSSSSSKIHIFL